LLALAVGLVAAPAHAHDQPFSWMDVVLAPGPATVRITLHRRDAAAVLGLPTPDSLASADFVARRAPQLADALGRRVRLSADGTAVPARFVRAEVDRTRRAVALEWRLALARRPGRLSVSAHLSDDPLHETFLAVHADGQVLRQAVITPERPGLDLYEHGARGALEALAVFVPAGVHHIFIGPDHILFIIGLMLLGGSAWRIAKIVSGFTVAHSATLALAALGLVQPPAWLVEPLIALSILCVGLDALWVRRSPRDLRVIAAVGFGLIHGFGFAGVLRELGLPREALAASLLGFNLGVELGQLCIVLAVVPPLRLLCSVLTRSGHPGLARGVVVSGAGVVALAGAVWLVQRVLHAAA
jgi:hydrogenase/urease accessory protein HupE